MRDHGNSNGFALRGTIYALLEDPKAALSDFNRVNFELPQAPKIHIYKAMCYAQLNNLAGMLKCLSEGLNRYPDHAELLKERA